jgi:hypothetical protein
MNWREDSGDQAKNDKILLFILCSCLYPILHSAKLWYSW